ncbi:MAG: DUF6456 domain-containing protein [Paracoccaceae bacterium]
MSAPSDWEKPIIAGVTCVLRDLRRCVRWPTRVLQLAFKLIKNLWINRRANRDLRSRKSALIRPDVTREKDISRQAVDGRHVCNWLPRGAVNYLAHTGCGASIRSIARAEGCHPSTVMRRVRRLEARREDPLVDEALGSIRFRKFLVGEGVAYKEADGVTCKASGNKDNHGGKIDREARRILRRLCEKDAFLLVSPDMERAAVFRTAAKGRPNKIAVLDREFARAFALNEWITGERLGKLGRYTITGVGRAALKRLLAEDTRRRDTATGFAESISPFRVQHQCLEERELAGDGGTAPRQVRYNLAESPLTALGRRRDRNGEPFLAAPLIEAGERLREDFEIAQIGPKVTQNWDRFLTAAHIGVPGPGKEPGQGPTAARERVLAALRVLGPGLADIAFRCCCFLEGLEAAERRLGWSARSGKVVLRIALGRLAEHYELTGGRSARAAG